MGGTFLASLNNMTSECYDEIGLCAKRSVSAFTNILTSFYQTKGLAFFGIDDIERLV